MPIGNTMTAGFAPSLSVISPTVPSKSAPSLSILFMKQIRGTLYLSACLQTVSDWLCTPSSASNTITPPSSTRSDRSTSAVKSTWPGVSIIFIRTFFQNVVVAADTMVIPRSRSCGIQSICVLPSSISPIL